MEEQKKPLKRPWKSHNYNRESIEDRDSKSKQNSTSGCHGLDIESQVEGLC